MIDRSHIHQLMGIEVNHHKDRSPYLHLGEIQQPTRQSGQQVFEREAKGVPSSSGEASKAIPVSPLIKASILTALASINSIRN